ncbi:MAG TPA: trigger factor [Flavipsychrobacter sp.]|nr:trigger factor [Flavipsychrobacter sp.]
MATVTRENIGTLHDKITVKLTKEDYWPSFEKSLKQYAKQANVPGFRKGMVPAAMVRKMYGPSIFGDEVFRTAGRQLEEYLKEEKLAIFAQPMIMPGANMNFDMNNPVEVDFSFEIGVKPDFDVPSLTNGTTLTKYKVSVSDKMLDDEVERIRRRYGKVEDLEAIAGDDNIIYTTYEASDAAGNLTPDAQKIEDTVLLEKLPAKLQEMLKGKKANDTLIIRPSEIAEGDALASFLKDPLKAPTSDPTQPYKLTITKVGLLQPRDLDAELYMQVFQNEMIATEEEFRNRLSQELSKEYDRITRERFQNEIYELLVHNTPLQLPVDFLKRWMKEGQEKPKSEAEVEKEFPGFDHQLRWTLISDKLIQDAGINVTIEDVKEDVKTRVLSYFGMDADEDAPWMESYMQKVVKDNKTMDETYRRILFDRLFQWLEEKFAVEQKEVTEEEFFKLADPHATHHHHH